MCFQSLQLCLAPSALCSQMLQKIILLCFFPRLAGNDLTTARKRNAKHSLELSVTSERRGGPCASASLDIPEHAEPKLPTAGVNCCLAPAPKQSRLERKKKLKSTPPSTPATSHSSCPVCEHQFLTSGSLLLTIVLLRTLLFFNTSNEN